MRAVITEYQAAMKRAAGDTTAMAKSAQGSFADLNRKVGDLGSELTRKVSLPLVATGAGALKLASDFDTSFAQMVGLAGVAGDEVAGLREEVMNLSKETAVGPQKLAEALYFIRSAGIDAAHAMEVLNASAKASAAGLGDPAVVARTLSAALNAYGASNLTAAHATDVLVAGIRAATFEPDQLAASLGTVIATASTMGITFDKLVGTLAVLSRTGLDAAEATTSLNAILSMLSNGGAAATQLLEAHGLSLQQLRDIAAGPGGVIAAMRLLDKTFGDDQEALSTIIPNVRAFRGAMTLLAQDSSIVDDVMNDVENSTGSMNDAFAAVKDTWSFKVKQGVVEVQAALIRLGELLGPTAALFGTTIGAIVSGFAMLPVPIQEVVVGLAAVAASAGPLMKVFGSLAGPSVSAIKSLASQIDLAVTSFRVLRLEGESTGAALAGAFPPAAAAVVALTAVTLGAVAIYKAYAVQKAEATARTNDFVAALKAEHDAQNQPDAPKPVLNTAMQQFFADNVRGGTELSTMLRKTGADMTVFAQSVAGGTHELQKWGNKADQVPDDLMHQLTDAAARGDVLAQQLLKLHDVTGLSDGDFNDLVRRLGDVDGALSGATDKFLNQTAAMNQASGATAMVSSTYLAAGQAATYLAGSVAPLAGSVDALDKAYGGSVRATAEQSRAWDIATQAAAFLAQGVANLASSIGVLFGATFDVGNAQQGFSDAVTDVDGAMRTGGGSTKDYAKDQRSLESATKDVTKAQEDLADAEKALAEARKGPSARDKQDASLNVRDAQLGLQQAQQAVVDAQKRLNEERKKGREGDVKGATLDLKAAQLALEHAQLRVTDAQADQNKVLKSGEEGSDKVTSALDALEQAQDRVTDATQRQMDAEATLRGDGASGGPVADRARTLRGAYDNLTTSGENWIQKLIESGAPTSEVIKALDAQREAAKKVIDTYGDPDGKLKSYLAFLDEIERRKRLSDSNDPSAIGQGGADASGVSIGPDGKPISVGARAKGGPALPFTTYEMGENGPEALTVGATSAPDKLGKGRASAEMSGRSAMGARTFMVGLHGPQVIKMGAQGGWVTPNHKLGDIDGARAAGGPVDAHGTYVVGENGPEIITVGGTLTSRHIATSVTSETRRAEPFGGVSAPAANASKWAGPMTSAPTMGAPTIELTIVNNVEGDIVKIANQLGRLSKHGALPISIKQNH